MKTEVKVAWIGAVGAVVAATIGAIASFDDHLDKDRSSHPNLDAVSSTVVSSSVDYAFGSLEETILRDLRGNDSFTVSYRKGRCVYAFIADSEPDRGHLALNRLAIGEFALRIQLNESLARKNVPVRIAVSNLIAGKSYGETPSTGEEFFCGS